MLGFLFLILARENKKSLTFYFGIGFLFSLGIRFIYLFIFGFFSNYYTTSLAYNNHRNYSIVVSIITTYILYRILKKKIKVAQEKQKAAVDDIGKD